MQSIKSFGLFVTSALILVALISCAKKDKQAVVPQSEPAAQSVAQAPAPAPVKEAPAPEPAAKPELHIDYTDVKDIAMDGSAAIGKTAKLVIMMDYSGVSDGTFRAVGCSGGQMVDGGPNFRMSFGASTKAGVREMKSMECGSTAIFKITGKGRLEDFTAKLIEYPAY